jgi:threonine dehydratase
MENGVVVNGNGNGRAAENGRPSTPSRNTLSLTEYSTNPSPPSESPRNKIRGVVPDEFILPNGYPDVCPLPPSNSSNQL